MPNKPVEVRVWQHDSFWPPVVQAGVVEPVGTADAARAKERTLRTALNCILKVVGKA